MTQVLVPVDTRANMDKFVQHLSGSLDDVFPPHFKTDIFSL